LSQQRAEVIKAFLVNKGIRANRIGTHGYGAALAIFEQARANERIEMEIKKY
jgi:outer membrane protein OmpA-like peptidoglycan-associated protein